MKTDKLAEIKNYLFPTGQGETNVMHPVPGSKDINKNLANYPVPVQFLRLRHDIKMWRDAITEAELAYYPQRAKMQRLYQDTVINGHVFACMDRRKNLTMLRDFKICDEKGVASDYLKMLFRNNNNSVISGVNGANWFDKYMTYIWEALPYGYSLVSLGDLIDGAYPEVTVIKRWHVAPDRMNVTGFVYALSGKEFLESPYVNWHIYANTPSETGVSLCGYGFLYKVAIYEIYLRNNMAYNADFVELFNQPFRVGSTTKTEESERAAFAASLRDSGSLGWMLKDEAEDKIEFIESKNVGTAHQSYSDFDKRLEQKISKIILGHADALESVPGKLGSSQGGKGESPTEIALAEKQSVDGIYMQNNINSELIPRMRLHGFDIPLNYHFEFENDTELQEIREKEDDSNMKVATIAYTMAQAGLKMKGEYFTERTDIPCEAAEILPKNNPDDNNATIK